MKTSLVLACSPNVIVTMFTNHAFFFLMAVILLMEGGTKCINYTSAKECFAYSPVLLDTLPVLSLVLVQSIQQFIPGLSLLKNLLFLHSLFFFFLILYNDILFNAIILIYAISLLNLVMKIMHLENKRPFVVIV